MRNVLDTVLENKNTHFMFNEFIPRKSCSLWDSIEKRGRAGQAADDNIAHVLCMMYN